MKPTTPMPRAKANRTFCKPRCDRFGRRRKLLSIFPNTQSWIDALGLNAKLSEMAQSVHNLAEGLKTPDARAIEKSAVAIFEVELKNESK